jgi:ABC-2 type transport system permease protein
MAGVTLVPGKHEQLFLVGWLRWRLFLNGLRTVTGKLNLAVQIMTGGLIGLLVAGLGPLLGIGSWYAISQHKPALLAGELWLVFVVWLLFPLVITGFGAESDPASLLRFPVRYSTFVLLAFAHGVFDPVAAACLYWLAAMLLGVAVASLSAMMWAIPAFAALALLNLLLNRTIYAWLSRWMAQRRTREILGAVFFLLMLSLQFVSPLARHYGRRAWPWMARLTAAARFLPPGMTAATITDGRAGHVGKACTEFAGLLVYNGVLGCLLAIRLRAEYRGENLSEAPRPAAEARSAVRVGWNVVGFSPTVAALFEKELRYLLRNSAAYFTLLAPLVIIPVLSMGRHPSPHPKVTGAIRFMLGSSTYFPLGVVYILLTLMGLAYNSLAYDGPGLPMLFAAPIRFRDVMVAKNLLHTMVLAAEVIAVFVVIQFVVGPTPPIVVGLTLAGALWALLMNLTAGNLISLYFPHKLKPGQMRRQQGSGVAVAVSLGVQVVVAGLAAALYVLSRWAGNMAWCGIGLLGLAGIAWLAYLRVLNLVSGIAWKRREALMAELSRPE